MHILFIFISLLLVVSCNRSIEYTRTYDTVQIVEVETHKSRFVDTEVTVIFNYNNVKDHIKLIIGDGRETIYKPVGEIKLEYGCKEYDAVSGEGEKVKIGFCEDDLGTISFNPYDLKARVTYINLDLPEESD